MGSGTGSGPLAVTMGEPAGIGGEILLKAWQAASANDLHPFFAIDAPARLQSIADRLELPVVVREISAPDEAHGCFNTALPVLPLTLPRDVKAGHLDPANAPAVLSSIKRAVDLIQTGEASGLVTNPIHKKNLYAAGFAHPGHTEYLAQLAGSDKPAVMMLACPGLKVIPVTIHLALKDAIVSLSEDAILHAGRTTAEALVCDFGIATPRLAVAGLNPHAGEDGAMGREEIEIIQPAVERLAQEGIDITGPLPADTLFHADARRRYDAVLCMYHDQALIPLKTIDFDRGVNVTLGLPFVRTSPDHGTALGIAGSGEARPDSMIAALQMAGAMVASRSTSSL
ncbi:4-hydroxythreonine-4-phosphate dehydrogenase PdxA [Denitrobaculum tricleocarpae]|uniref:4-hydroxythreonine-4-phosphate dehydrogenase n=2 Tax=Denitrobaculum tricleocarpae TaxID=2591009 RepID=A0A545TUS8_9PROT|nr:4-hydroxythreonine-4-phosphate dehydrogenase PdxA [Denitrobaculum tricleocarpae]